MSDTQGTWKGSAPFGTGWNADVVEAVGSDLAINNGTIDVAAITADTLWGNPQTIAAKPTPVAIGPGLTLPATGTLAAQWQTGTAVSVVGSDLNVNSGTIDLAPITAASLYGNPGTAAAKPSAIAVGSGLTLSAAGTLSNTGILSLAAGTNVTITGGNTINASAGGSGISSLVIGSGLSPAGTISSGGTTVSLGTIAASSLMGNAGTVGAVPGAIAVGANLTLSAAGTLSASAGGTGTVTQVVAGAGLAGGTITTAGTISAQWQGGTVTAEGNSVVINSGTIDFDQTPTYFSASRTLATTDRGLWLVDNSTGTTDIVVTLPTLAAGTKLNVAIQNNSTAHTLRIRPAGSLVPTIDGVANSDYLLGTFTGARIAIDSTGTAYVVDAGNIFWQPSAGYVAALGNGLTVSNNGTFNTNGTLGIALVGGSGITISNGNTINSGATSGYFFAPAMPIVLGTQAVNTVGAATSGNMVTFAATSTLAAVGWLLDSLTNAGSYVASITPVNASGVATSGPTNSATLIASGTSGGWFNFAFSPAVTVAAGSTYALSLSVLNEGTAFVEPVRWTGIAGRGSWRNTNAGGTSNVNNGIFQNLVTAITNGLTLAGKNTGFYYMTMDILP